MSLILSVKDESNFKPCPAGSHHATCIRIIDLGTQLVEYQNEQKRQHKILVQWEIDPEGDPEMLMPDGSLTSSAAGTPPACTAKANWQQTSKAGAEGTLHRKNATTSICAIFWASPAC